MELRTISAVNAAPALMLVRREAPAHGSYKLGHLFKGQWGKFGFALVIGSCIGIGAAAAISHDQSTSPATPLATPVVTTPATTYNGTDAEVEQLRIRNRRLEALVAVLRHRTDRQSSAHQSTPAER